MSQAPVRTDAAPVAPAEAGVARPVARVAGATPTSDGAGVSLNRMIGTPQVGILDPFLMLDYFASDKPQDYLAGFPDHPHRGFETVTYMLAGRMRHADNQGHSGVIEAGGVQWMTAGRGIVHSEMPEQEAGLMHGFQLWVNLPSQEKMSAPKYAEYPADRIPAEARDGATVKVVAGTTSRGTEGPVRAEHVDARYFDVELAAGAAFAEPLPPDHTAAVVVFEGALEIAGTRVEALGIAALGEGDRVEAAAGGQGARFLLLSGRPLNEPVAWAGPIVMNTEAELQQAFADLRAGRF